MFPRWLWFNHVPAGLELTAEQYADVKRRVRAMGPEQRRFTPMSRRILARLLPTLAMLTAAFGVWLLWLIRARPSGAWMIVSNVMGILIFQALMWMAIAWSINRAIAPLVWRALNQAGFRVCEGCGYILDYLSHEQTRCPECGHAIHPPLTPKNRPLP
jgi:hypothetical protein